MTSVRSLMLRRLAASLALSIGLLVLGAPAALADAAGPTNYRSEVTGFDPPVDAVSAEVFGGDAFIAVAVDPGHELVVAGYEDDPAAAPYLRIDEEGNVFVNRRSPAAFLNAARYGSRDATVPPDADPEAPPVWEQVASGGRYAWHDHRIHWMSPSTPPQVDEGAGAAQPVFKWRLPVLVDGEPTVITGTLVWLPPRSPVLPLAVAAAVLVAAGLAIRHRWTATVPVVAAAALFALGRGVADTIVAPPGAEADPLRIILPGVALFAVVTALSMRSRGERTVVGLATLGAVPLLVWVVLQLAVLTAPVLVGGLPDAAIRYGIAGILGAAVAALVTGGLSLVEPLEHEAAPPS